MTHRAEQVIERIRSRIAGFPDLAINASNVYVHRRYTLSEEQNELDAISVDMGDDESVSEFGVDNLSFIDSLLSVPIMMRAKHANEETLRRQLMQLRRQIHQAIMADQSLGLSFVIGARYAGAAAIEIDMAGDSPIGTLECLWRIHYRMRVTDPGDD